MTHRRNRKSRKRFGIFKFKSKRTGARSSNRRKNKIARTRRRSVAKRKFFGHSLHFLQKALIVIISISVLYFTYSYVVSLKRHHGSVMNLSTLDFMENVPKYPQSTHIATIIEDRELITQLQSASKDVYILDRKHHFYNDVVDFYLQYMPQYGWELVQNVPLTSDEMLPGLYWVKDGHGLHIYSNVDEIWYEKISEEEARTGLHDKVVQQKKRDLIMASNNGTDLLPNFPWQLTVPENYSVKYFDTSNGEKGVKIRSLTDNEYIFIEPAIDLNINDEREIQSYIKNKVIQLSQQLKESTNTDAEAPQADETPIRYPYQVLFNQKTQSYYIVYSTKSQSPLLEYILDNIKDRGVKEEA